MVKMYKPVTNLVLQEKPCLHDKTSTCLSLKWAPCFQKLQIHVIAGRATILATHSAATSHQLFSISQHPFRNDGMVYAGLVGRTKLGQHACFCLKVIQCRVYVQFPRQFWHSYISPMKPMDASNLSSQSLFCNSTTWSAYYLTLYPISTVLVWF